MATHLEFCNSKYWN